MLTSQSESNRFILDQMLTFDIHEKSTNQFASATDDVFLALNRTHWYEPQIDTLTKWLPSSIQTSFHGNATELHVVIEWGEHCMILLHHLLCHSNYLSSSELFMKRFIHSILLLGALYRQKHTVNHLPSPRRINAVYLATASYCDLSHLGRDWNFPLRNVNLGTYFGVWVHQLTCIARHTCDACIRLI